MSPAKKVATAINNRIPRTSQVIAALGLVTATIAAVGGLAYSIVLNGSSTAEATLGNVALAGVSGLLVLAGVRNSDPGDKS